LGGARHESGGKGGGGQDGLGVHDALLLQGPGNPVQLWIAGPKSVLQIRGALFVFADCYLLLDRFKDLKKNRFRYCVTVWCCLDCPLRWLFALQRVRPWREYYLPIDR
jgi:hypothetical protein